MRCVNAIRRQTVKQPARYIHRATPTRAAAAAVSVGPGIPRSSTFKQIDDNDITAFRSMIGADAVVTDADRLQGVNTDWMNKFHGDSKLLLKPANTQEVSQILAYCHERSLAVVPQSGNTGLVGGSVPVYDEIVMSLARLNTVHAFDNHSGIVSVGAGIVLEDLSNWLGERGFIVPLDLGAKGSCMIGGNVSTNAGGLRLVRYGSLHGSVLGIEVVRADGRIVDLMSTLRKDNTGFDLKQLFIGAEGTLGVITQVALLTPRKPSSVQVAFLGCESFDAVLKTLSEARIALNDIVSALEFLDRPSMDLVLKHIPGARDPLEAKHPFYMLIETSGSNAEHDSEKLNTFLEHVIENGSVVDGVVAQDETQQKALWVLREHITDSLGKEGAVYKYDISIPLTHFYEMVENMRNHLKVMPRVGVVGYGHLGDSNLHLNIHSPTWDPQLFAMIEPWLFEQVQTVRGSISAEHGLGQSKGKFLSFSKSAEAIEMMREIKQVLDPKGILNPYKVLPQ